MHSFKNFLTEIRQGLPHLHSTPTPSGGQTPSPDVEQFKHLTKGGKVHLHKITEKTDGQTFKIGHDEHGFYTQHSGSGQEKARTGKDHIDRAKRRSKETGREFNPKPYEAMAKFHDALHKNKKLQDHLRNTYNKHGKEVVVRGEAFNKHMATPGDKKGEVKYVHTSYKAPDTHHGAFVIHSQLPENEHHDTEHFKKNLSDNHIKFDDDKIHHKPGHVDVKHEVSQFKKLDHALLSARTTKSNKEAKMAEHEKFNNIKKSVHHKVVGHIKEMGIKNKWGSGTEGLVVHPSHLNPHAPRFKVVTDSFKKAKASSTKFKK